MTELNTTLVNAIAKAVLTSIPTEELLKELENRNWDHSTTIAQAITLLSDCEITCGPSDIDGVSEDQKISAIHYLLCSTDSRKVNDFIAESMDENLFELPENVINDAINEWIDNNRPQQFR